MQAVQRSVGECFGAVDQVLGGAGHVALITAQPMGSADCVGGCATQQVADLGEGVFEAEVLVHDGEGGGSGMSLFMDKAPAWIGSHYFADHTRQKVEAVCGVRYRKTGPCQTEVCPHTAAIDGCSALRLLITGSRTRSLICSDEAKASHW